MSKVPFERALGAIGVIVLAAAFLAPAAAAAEAPAGGGLVDVLCTLGHRIETLGMCKPLPP